MSESGFIDPIAKFETPARLAELAPAETLKRLGFGAQSVLCDIGAGTGIFTFAAAALSREPIYALDVSDDMLGIIARKAAQVGADNVRCVKVTEAGFNLPPGVADMVLMCSMLHGMPDKPRFLSDAAALLKPEGRIVIIEFHYRETPMGPPVIRRLGPDELTRIAAAAHLSRADMFDLGDNFYCAVFTK